MSQRRFFTPASRGKRGTVALDLDGTLAAYSGWSETIGDPLPGAYGFVQDLRDLGFSIVVFTARRPLEGVQAWLDAHGFDCEATAEKPPASVFLDDRAITFRGDYGAALQQIEAFAPWWKP